MTTLAEYSSRQAGVVLGQWLRASTLIHKQEAEQEGNTGNGAGF